MKIETNNPHIENVYEVKPDLLFGILTNGMEFTIEALPEDMDATDYWHNETDCFDTRKQARAHANKSKHPFWWCVIKMKLTNPKNTLHVTGYMGACSYKNGQAFINDPYFGDMLEERIEEIKTL